MVPFFITGLQDENKVRAHNEVPRIAGLFKTRLPEEEVCSSAQTDETSVNPVVPTNLKNGITSGGSVFYLGTTG